MYGLFEIHLLERKQRPDRRFDFSLRIAPDTSRYSSMSEINDSNVLPRGESFIDFYFISFMQNCLKISIVRVNQETIFFYVYIARSLSLSPRGDTFPSFIFSFVLIFVNYKTLAPSRVGCRSYIAIVYVWKKCRYIDRRCNGWFNDSHYRNAYRN